MFTTASLLIVAGTAYIANLAGLSMSLGAFMAGVLLSESEYRHELQADIAPFEGLLLGFFFISVGMSADLASGVRASRAAGRRHRRAAAGEGRSSCFVLALLSRQKLPDAVRFSLALPQASEFSFVLFGAAVAVGALAPGSAAMATLVAAVVDGGDAGAVRAVGAVRDPAAGGGSRRRITTRSRRRTRR